MMDKDKQDKYKIAASVKHIPKDAQVIMSILKELCITEYEPRVINQLLEFTYRYVTCILDDAKIYANHAKKKIIDLDDVKIASDMILEKTFTGPPPRDVLLEIARNKIAPLPPIKNLCGLRLPPDRYCVIAANYKLRPGTFTKKTLGKPVLEIGRSTIKSQFTGRFSQQSQNDKVKRSNAIVVTNKAQPVTAPKPVFKFNTSKAFGSTAPVSTTITNTPVPVGDVQMDVDEDGILLTTIKRKREDDEFDGD